MQTPTRPDPPAHRAAARRNYVIFGIAACFGVTALVAVVTMLLV